MRVEFIAKLVEAAKKDKRIWLITPDLGYGVLEPFAKAFPERFINAGIAEQNAVGMAAGLAAGGKIPYVYSIAPFVYARPFEQVRVDVAYQNLPVRLVGVGGGLAYGSLGATHHSTEDLAVMRALPNMTVMAPGCINEAEAVAEISVKLKGPMYIRLGNRGEPDYGYKIELGKFAQVVKGKGYALIAIGGMLEAAEKIARTNGWNLFSAHTLKPFDETAVLKLVHAGTPIITLEEHNIIGGLASATSDVIARSGMGAKFLPLAIPDKFSHIVGGQQYIRDHIGLGDLEKRIKKFLLV